MKSRAAIRGKNKSKPNLIPWIKEFITVTRGMEISKTNIALPVSFINKGKR